MILVQNDTLSESLIQEVLSWNESTKTGDVWASNQVKWIDSLKYATSGTILSRVIPDEFKNKIYWDLVNRGKISYFPYSSSALFYIGCAGSCVNWHADYDDYNALSIYLNREWDSNWGGWFAYSEEYNHVDNIRPTSGKFISPSYNLSILSTDKEWHSTTPISPMAPQRISIQLFFSKTSS